MSADNVATSPLDLSNLLYAYNSGLKKKKLPALWRGDFAKVLGFATAFDGVAMYIMATLARLAYYSDLKYRQSMADALFADQFGVFNIDDNFIPRVPFFRIGTKVFLGIEGTNRWRQWLAQATSSQVIRLQGTPGAVWKVMGDLGGAIMTQIAAHFPSSPVLDFYIAGHSLGGALANVVGALIKGTTPHFARLICTFGAPRVGDREFDADFFWVNTYRLRVTNEDDPVPAIPPAVSVAFADGFLPSPVTFKHGEDRQVFFDRDGSISDSSFRGAPSLQAVGALGDLAHLDVIPQHKVAVYVSNCCGAAWRERYRYTGTQDALDDLNLDMDADDGATYFLPKNNPDLAPLQKKARQQSEITPESIRTFIETFKSV